MTLETSRGTIPEFDVLAVGNALVDVLAHAPDDFLGDHGMVKGSMTLIDADRALDLHRSIGTSVEMSGGSAANTMCGIASFGGRAAYIWVGMGCISMVLMLAASYLPYIVPFDVTLSAAAAPAARARLSWWLVKCRNRV